ncbi:hypothetical protein DFP73DRAFT_174550 [Morchella snyderi]|nr:hypothetical protein DFP73DRAFT_174550 [Morchella snyderi]
MSPKPTNTSRSSRHASSPLMASIFSLFSVNLFAYILSYLSWATRVLAQRWRRLKDALFYEMMLLLLQPNPVVLLLMWPGWIVVVGAWLWWGRDGGVAPVGV